VRFTAERIDDLDYGPYWQILAEDEDGKLHRCTESANRRDPKSLEDLYAQAIRPPRPSELVMAALDKDRPPRKRPNHTVKVEMDYLYDRRDGDPITFGWECKTCRKQEGGFESEQAAQAAGEGHVAEVLAWRAANGLQVTPPTPSTATTQTGEGS